MWLGWSATRTWHRSPRHSAAPTGARPAPTGATASPRRLSRLSMSLARPRYLPLRKASRCYLCVINPERSSVPAPVHTGGSGLDTGQRPHELADELAWLGPREAWQRGAQRDGPVQGDPDGGGVRQDVGARRRAGRHAGLDGADEQRERFRAELQHRPAVGADRHGLAVVGGRYPPFGEQHAVALRVSQAERHVRLASRD